MNHCDLSLEALLKLARRSASQSCISQLCIPGLHADHLELCIAAGWMVKKPCPKFRTSDGRDVQKDHSPHYSITDAGREHIMRLTDLSRIEANATRL